MFEEIRGVSVLNMQLEIFFSSNFTQLCAENVAGKISENSLIISKSRDEIFSWKIFLSRIIDLRG